MVRPAKRALASPSRGRWLEEPEGLNFATVLNVLGNGEVLSPTRFAGAPSQRGPSPLLHTVKGEGAQELLRAL